MANRHILRDDGGLRTRRRVNRHHLCGQGPITLGIFSGSDQRSLLQERLPDDDELRVARPVAVVLLATVPRSDSRTGN